MGLCETKSEEERKPQINIIKDDNKEKDKTIRKMKELFLEVLIISILTNLKS